MAGTKHLNISRLRQLVNTIMALRLGTREKSVAAMGYSAPESRGGRFAHVKGRKSLSQKQRSNRRKAAARR